MNADIHSTQDDNRTSESHKSEGRKSEGRKSEGRCLCGGVSYAVDGHLRPVWNCHCWRCRRWTGHFMAATNCARDEIAFDSDETLEWHHPSSDPNVVYGFCRRCGSSLFWTVVGSARISICAGTLDPPTGLSTDVVVFSEDASDYHTLDTSSRRRPAD